MSQIYKEGDRVTCKPGFEKYGKGDEDGGAGYEPFKTFVIGRITNIPIIKDAPKGSILWPEGGGNGIYEHVVEFANGTVNNYEIY